MNIRLNEYWTLEKSIEDSEKNAVLARIDHCSNLINELKPKVLTPDGIETTRYEEFLLYIKTLSKIKESYKTTDGSNLTLLENRLDILQDRLSDMYLVFKLHEEKCSEY